ncbi:MAG: phenylalanine--tRNA ligase subunit beta [Acidobacteria bacterium]|nr:phenylalanine--tRNA ligase subunit beta [Acidobacteriota bacterium]
MRIAFEWIREYAPVGCKPAELSRLLTSAGLAVERLEKVDGIHTMEIDVTTNRPDCMNLYGICRESAAHSRTRLRPIRPRIRESGPRLSGEVGIEVRVPELCPRYSARAIFGIRVVPSPEWIRKRLVTMGIRPVNLIVDVTNYVLMEIGQPLHAFDLDLIDGRRIVVRKARRGERITTLDGIERKLPPETLVIADASRAVAIAGIMGGQETEIRATTRNILLESAYFDPRSIRKTARNLGLHTEASHRFERGADIEITRLALDRCCEILLEAGKGEIARGCLDAYPRRRKPKRLKLRSARIAHLLGDPIRVPEMARSLRALGFTVYKQDSASLSVGVPSFRSDIDEEVDLIEEVARCRGYDRIPSRLPILPGQAQSRSRTGRSIRRVKAILSALGYQEAINLSMVDPALEEKISGPPGDRVEITNPISERASVLRRSLLPGLLQNLAFNGNRGVRDLKMFELGKVFRMPPSGKVPEENNSLGIAVIGRADPAHWSRKPASYSLFHLKGVLETLLRRLGLQKVEFRPAAHPVLGNGRLAEILVSGKVLGILCRLPAGLTEPFGIEAESPVHCAELNLDRLQECSFGTIRYRPVSRYPAIRRDLALVVDSGQSFADIEREIRDVDGERIAAVEIFDRYRAKDLPDGKVSLGVRIQYQHPDRTFLKEEVSLLEEQILFRLKSKFGITLRGGIDAN